MKLKEMLIIRRGEWMCFFTTINNQLGRKSAAEILQQHFLVLKELF